MNKLKNQWLTHLRQRNLSDATVTTYAKHFKFIEAALGDKDVTVKEIESYVSELRERVSSNTVNLRLAVMKSFYGFLYMSGVTMDDKTKLIPKIRKTRRVIKDVPTISQVRKIIMSPDMTTLTGYRDRTMIILTYAGALRRSEMLSIEADEANALADTVKILRKGGETQQIPIGFLASEYLNTYHREIRPLLNPKCDAFFVSGKGKRIMPNTWTSMFKKHAQNVGLGQFSPHSLRHAAATHMTRNGADVRAVQFFLGHKDIESTEVYTKVDMGFVKNMIEKIFD